MLVLHLARSFIHVWFTRIVLRLFQFQLVGTWHRLPVHHVQPRPRLVELWKCCENSCMWKITLDYSHHRSLSLGASMISSFCTVPVAYSGDASTEPNSSGFRVCRRIGAFVLASVLAVLASVLMWNVLNPWKSLKLLEQNALTVFSSGRIGSARTWSSGLHLSALTCANNTTKAHMIRRSTKALLYSAQRDGDDNAQHYFTASFTAKIHKS
jgi:hypothetical protein